MAKKRPAKDDDDYYDDYDQAPRQKGGMSAALIIVLVMGGLCVVGVPVVAIVAAVAIPNLLEARKHGNEASAIGSLRAISAAQAIYREREGKGIYGSLSDLEKKSYIDSFLGGGNKQGYVFEVGTFDNGQDFWAKASPGAPGDTGDRYFFLNSSGVISFSTSNFTVNKTTGRTNKKLKVLGSR